MDADLPEAEGAVSDPSQNISSAETHDLGEAAPSAIADDHLAAVLSQSGFDMIGGFEHVLDQLTVATDLFDVPTVHFDGHSDS
jgi:hypothetical protein